MLGRKRSLEKNLQVRWPFKRSLICGVFRKISIALDTRKYFNSLQVSVAPTKYQLTSSICHIHHPINDACKIFKIINNFFFLLLKLQASGVTVSDVCKTTYEEIKKDKKHRYVIFYIRDEKQIDVEVIGDRNAEYDQFLEDIQKGGSGECRYGLFDFEYMHQCQGTSESSKKQKLFLMSWWKLTSAALKISIWQIPSFQVSRHS